MKAKIVLMAILTWLTLVGVSFGANAQYAPDIILTSPDAFWLDSRAKLDLAAAVTAIGSDVRDLVIAGSESTTANLTIPSTTHVRAMRGAAITVQVATTLLIEDLNIDAGDSQLFYGTGNVDFADGAVVRSSWFEDLDEAILETYDDKVTLVIAETDTLIYDRAIGDDVSLMWESEGALINISSGTTLSNLDTVDAGEYVIFGGTGTAVFNDIVYYKSIWSSTVNLLPSSEAVSTIYRGGIYYIDYRSSDQGTIDTINRNYAYYADLVGSIESIFILDNNSGGVTTPYIFLTPDTAPENITLKFEPGAKLATPASGVSFFFTHSSQIQANKYQQIFADGSNIQFVYSNNSVEVGWWGATSAGFQAAADSFTTKYPGHMTNNISLPQFGNADIGNLEGWAMDSGVTFFQNSWQINSIRGEDKRGTRLYGATGIEGQTMISLGGYIDGATNYNVGPYRTIADFTLRGTDLASGGIDATRCQYLNFDNVMIDSLVNPSSSVSAYGIKTTSAIVSSWDNVHIGPMEGHGLVTGDGSGSIFNGNVIKNSSFVNIDGVGVFLQGSTAGNVYLGNTYEDCGIGIQFSGFSTGADLIDGGYFEFNKECDIYVGSNTYTKALTIQNAYINGYNPGFDQSTSYTPIRVKFARGLRIMDCMLNNDALANLSPNGYLFLDADLPGGVVEHSVIRNGFWREHFSYPDDSGLLSNQIYNISPNWVDYNNSLIDPIFAPFVDSNIITDRLPYGGWTIGTAGGSTIERAGEDYAGMPTAMMTRGTGQCLLTRKIPIPDNYKNTFITVTVPVKGIVTPSANNTLYIDASGASSESAETTFPNRTIWAWKSATCYADNDADELTVSITLGTNGSQLVVGQPCIFQGATPFYENKGDQDWIFSAAPTDGVWSVSDKVIDISPTSTQPVGWICTSSGTFSAATDSTGGTVSGSDTISDMTDNSDFYVGEYLTVSAGFAGSPRILAKSGTTVLILDANASSTNSNVTVSTTDPTFVSYGDLN